MPKYKVITESVENLEGALNEHRREGWKPVLMSTTPTALTGGPIAVTVILETPRA